jgi:hypothetical protein
VAALVAFASEGGAELTGRTQEDFMFEGAVQTPGTRVTWMRDRLLQTNGVENTVENQHELDEVIRRAFNHDLPRRVGYDELGRSVGVEAFRQVKEALDRLRGLSTPPEPDKR